METVKTHPTLTNYGADEDGNIYNLKLGKKVTGTLNNYGYRVTSIGGNSVMFSHFVYECFNGEIEKGLQIDHKDNIRDNNKLSNLQKLTPSENNKKKFIDGYLRNGQKMHRVEVTDPETGEKKIYRSITGAGTATGTCPASVRRVCRGEYQAATSKIDNKKYLYRFVC